MEPNTANGANSILTPIPASPNSQGKNDAPGACTIGANSPPKSPHMEPAPIVINVTKRPMSKPKSKPKPKAKAISPPPPACTECEQYSALITEHISLQDEHISLQDKYSALITELGTAKDEIAQLKAELAAAHAQLNLDLLRKLPDPPAIAADGSCTYTMNFMSTHKDTVCFASPTNIDFKRIYVPHSLLKGNQKTITVNIGRTGDHKLRLIKMAKGSGDDAYAADAFSGSIYLPHKYRQFKDLFLSLM